ncbi:Tetrahydrofolate synthase [Ascochyta lentis]
MQPRTFDRSYKSAITILQSRRRPERPNVEPGSNLPGLSRIPDAKGKPDLKGTPSIVGMKQWLNQLGHSTADVDNLNIIHVAGTKGKGSTCAFIESFLRVSGQRTGFPRKTGLYTSPHLIYPEERIRIDFRPIERPLFAKYFFEVWDALTDGNSSPHTLPRYLQLVALVSIHAFIKEGVEAAIFETHHGGEYDATNVIEHPVATVVTTLGMDHVKQLGPTLENIAWHKAGIFKIGTRAFSSPQEASAAEVLRNRASEKAIDVHFVDNDSSLPANALQLKPDVQRTNCSVALAAVRHFLEEKRSKGAASLSSSDIEQGINQFSWPGRFQIIREGAFNWLLDGAHNEMSVSKAAEWFIESSQAQRAPVARILIFSQVSEQRDSQIVLEQLANDLSAVHIHHVIFTNYDPKQDFESATTIMAKPEDTSHVTFSEIWKRFHKKSHILYEPNIQKALDSARRLGTQAGGMHTLVTGSQHLVGGALYSLNK